MSSVKHSGGALRWTSGILLLCAAVYVRAADPQTRPAESADSGDVMMLMSRSVQQFNEGGYEDAIGLLEKVLDKTPNDRAALLLRALAHGELALQRKGDIHDHYDRMGRDLDLLLSRIEGPEAILLLIDGVLQTRLSGLSLERRDEHLQRARRAFEQYLSPPPESGIQPPAGLNRVRGQYFLGVVIYKQSLRPPSAPGEPQELKSRASLDDAAERMQVLVDPKSPDYIDRVVPPEEVNRENEVRTWLAYANLYMGLIAARQGNDEVEAGQSRAGVDLYEKAEVYLKQAWQKDYDREYPEEAESVTGSDLPTIVKDQVLALEQAKAATPEPVNDLALEWRSGVMYDSNVVLLGENTDLPRGVPQKHDMRWGTGVKLGYTLDMGNVRKELAGLTLGLQGRSGAIWNDEVHTYNEQDHGASVALQYQLTRQQTDGRRHGPIYLGIQYDYDYFLLGNDGFLRTNRVSPSVTAYTFDQLLTTSLAFRYEDRNYLEPLYDKRYDRDGNYFAMTLTQEFRAANMSAFYAKRGIEPWGLALDPKKLPESGGQPDPEYDRWLRPFIGIEYGWDSTVGQEFDEKRTMLFAGVQAPLPYGLTLDFGADWEWQNYQGVRGGSLIDYHRRGREDLVQRYRFGLERRFVLKAGEMVNRWRPKMDRLVMVVRGDIMLTDDDSNVQDRLDEAIFSYDRAVYGLSVALQYN